MIKVMVVEDEPPILRDIVHLIENTNHHFKVVSTAYNGQQAMSLLESDPPDIVFTDIHMPVVDGLELIAYLRKKGIAAIPVIISGYNEFQYAKSAMSMGVTHYLLKPVNVSELSELLQKIHENIMQETNVRERKALSEIIKESTAANTIDPHLSGQDSVYLLMLLCAGNFPKFSVDNYYLNRKNTWEQIDLELLSKALIHPSDRIWAFNGKTLSEKVLIFTLSTKTPGFIHMLSNELFNKVKRDCSPVTMIVSNPVDKIGDIGITLMQMRKSLGKTICIGVSEIINVDTNSNSLKKMPDSRFLDSDVENKLIRFIQQGNISLFKSELRQVLTNMERLKLTQLTVENQLRSILSALFRYLGDFSSIRLAEIELEISEAVLVSKDYSDLLNNIWYLFEELFNLRLERSTNSDSTELLMQKIDKYLVSNLGELINHQKLSEVFGLVPSYLSKQFKKYKGMSPADYLIKLRIEKAKEIFLSQPDILTKDVAMIVGFTDPFYFSKIFKKETGMSPSVFRAYNRR